MEFQLHGHSNMLINMESTVGRHLTCGRDEGELSRWTKNGQRKDGWREKLGGGDRLNGAADGTRAWTVAVKQFMAVCRCRR